MFTIYSIYSPYSQFESEGFTFKEKKDFYVKISENFQYITKRLTWNRFDFDYKQYYQELNCFIIHDTIRDEYIISTTGYIGRFNKLLKTKQSFNNNQIDQIMQEFWDYTGSSAIITDTTSYFNR